MANLLESVQGMISPGLVSRTSTQLGEPESGVAKAFSGIIPAVLAGLVSKTSEPGAMSNLFNMIRQQDDSSLTQLRQAIPGTPEAAPPAGPSFLSEIFGGRLDNVTHLLSNFAGIKPSSVTAILGYVAPLVMGWLGKKTKDENLDAGGLSQYLSSQKAGILNALPAGLGAVLGLGGLGGAETLQGQRPVVPAAGTAAAAAAAAATSATSRAAGSAAGGGTGGLPGGLGQPSDHKKTNWLWPLLLIGAAILLFIFGLRTCKEETREEEVTITETRTETETTSPEAAGTRAGFSQKELPGGVMLSIPENGIESKLVAFIEDKNKAVDKTTWFTFDRLHFETGSATILTESQEQLNNIAEIMKAYPGVEIKIGGYTDNVGNPASNMKLSQSRAKAVQEALQQAGIAASRLEAEGYGEQHPVADNSSEEGRARNRRIDVRVTKK
ncbi:MAG: OmpA family protein [Adhaeribacter sp.]